MKFKSLFLPVCFVITTVLLISCNSANNQEEAQQVLEEPVSLITQERLANANFAVFSVFVYSGHF